MKQKVYGVRKGAPFKKGDAQAIGEFIDSVEVKSSKKILARIKKNKKHIIHGLIEWDDSIAGEEFRLQQVRNIVNHVTIEIKEIGDGLPVRAFFSVNKPDNGDTTVYVDLNTTFSDDYYRSQVISRAKSELSNWQERYHQYNELRGIVGNISKFLDKG